MTEPTNKMTLAEFEQRLPEFFATGTGTISDDPRLKAFLLENPDAAALVHDFESIVEAAKGLFDDAASEPSDAVWANIVSELGSEAGSLPDESTAAHTPKQQ